jgi:threonyl-tRNA synthetase
MQKIPYAIVVGDKEAEQKLVNVRKYGDQKSASLPLDELLSNLKSEISNRSYGK